MDYIYPTMDAKTRTLKVRLKFDNADERMKPNMYAKVSIFGTPLKKILTIPREAVIRSGHGERVVLAMGKGRFKAQKIRTGIESGGRVEILEGLEEGKSVVTSAQFLIDSQASLKGSLERMEEPKEKMAQTDQKDQIKSEEISSTGILRQIIADERKIKLFHAPIPELKWPTMTMDFQLQKGLAVPTWPAGTKVQFKLRKLDEFTFEISRITKREKTTHLFEATGVLRVVMDGENKVKITHDPIPALKWPTMTMDFPLAPGVEVANLVVGGKVRFTLRKSGEFSYQITAIQANAGSMDR